MAVRIDWGLPRYLQGGGCGPRHVQPSCVLLAPTQFSLERDEKRECGGETIQGMRAFELVQAACEHKIKSICCNVNELIYIKFTQKCEETLWSLCDALF